ncbi:MAG: flagellar basal body L-ring protein [Candidatus Saganbacteria bacterium]|uniref:Flagellar basal body L-ring protein n=1 Tax=Candidatus Saganbacteria bacterium TaxID=2575572 RepID=A0A833L0F0_UNCSA|nr:MAG: flagellar basal body L-ring protein [Candidatus Saganbacteria bacterium]
MKRCLQGCMAASIILLVTFCNIVGADSIWKTGVSPYSPEKAFKVGDIITIIILENTTAQNKAGTTTDVKDDLGFKFTHSIERLAPIIGTNNTLAGQEQQKYSGIGSTQRQSNVQAKVAAAVEVVLPNGNIKISGSHRLSVNDEKQEILISGIIRSKDISISNTIYSYQVADAEISIKGNGVVQEAEAPGWITRLLNWLF